MVEGVAKWGNGGGRRKEDAIPEELGLRTRRYTRKEEGVHEVVVVVGGRSNYRRIDHLIRRLTFALNFLAVRNELVTFCCNHNHRSTVNLYKDSEKVTSL